MKTINFFGILVLGTIFSCNQEIKTEKAGKEEIPLALQDEKYSLKTYGREDIIDELYSELLEKSPDLKKLLKEIDDLKNTEAEAKSEFHNYNGKSLNYYSAANDKINLIKDSLIRVKIKEVINKSIENYEAETGHLNALMKQISTNDAFINDDKVAMKLLLTMPIMLDYQKKKKPSDSSLKQVEKLQQKILKRQESILKMQLEELNK